MTLDDSLQVMASLAECEGLRGKVQYIYFDPPYGIKFNSNFQWSTISRDVKDFVKTYRESQPKLAAWSEDNLPVDFNALSFPQAQRKRLRTSTACENVNGQIKKRTRVVGLFPSEESLLRLARRRARGYRAFCYFQAMAYWIAGGLVIQNHPATTH